MAKYLEDTAFDALAIRDTDQHTSNAIQGAELPMKTVIINNGLNQPVTLQLQASRDNVNFFNVGSSFEAAASSWSYQTCDTYFPFGRVIAQCSVAPSSGTLSCWCGKVGVM